MKIAKKLNDRGIKIIHQTGKRDYERVKKFYKNTKIEADVFDFYPKLYEKIQKADFAISRAGASTLFELAANQIPTLFIPYPYAAKDHQFHNAKFLADKSAALLKRQNELSLDTVEEIFNADLTKISNNLKKFAKKDGAKYIVEQINVLSI
jgi:UDP-N-acetylglucosamine--N-acetylmuramyl-(pentapeptide) pyrophosphoryl-undecaprenol N-acetylglucosamine transferase